LVHYADLFVAFVSAARPVEARVTTADHAWRRAGYSVAKVCETVTHNARHVTRGSATLTSNDVTRAVILYDFMSQVSQASLRTSWRVIEKAKPVVACSMYD